MGIVPAKPHYYFGKVLKIGMVREPDVVALQNVLKYENLFPANQSSTGNYLEVTRRAVEAFQRKYQVADVVELDQVRGNTVGLKTLALLNKLYK